MQKNAGIVNRSEGAVKHYEAVFINVSAIAISLVCHSNFNPQFSSEPSGLYRFFSQGKSITHDTRLSPVAMNVTADAFIS